MLLAIIIPIALCTCALVFIAWELHKAPQGVEDETGFHVVKQGKAPGEGVVASAAGQTERETVLSAGASPGLRWQS